MRARSLHLAQHLILLLAAAATITQPHAFAQQAAPSTATTEAEPPEPIGPSFEVASIRPTTQDGRNWGGFQLTPGGRLTASRVRVTSLVSFSYGAKPLNTMVVGGPKWAESDEFDISAKVDDAQMAGWDKLSDAQRMEKVKPMIRALLVERFHLKLHTEMRVMSVDVLLQTKGGAKLKEVAAPPPTSTTPEAQERAKADRAAGKAPPGGFMMTGGTWTGNACSMGILAAQIGGNSGNDRPVVDQTGLKGFYDFTFNESRDENGPTFEQQLEDQLGLKLEPRKVPIKTYIIDSVDKPSIDGAELPEPPPATLKPVAFVQEKPAPLSPTDTPYVPTMTFDVASIRETKSADATGHGGGWLGAHPELVIMNMNVLWLVQMGYGVETRDLSGQPGWAGETDYVVHAKSDAATDQKFATLDKEQTNLERRHMVQTLLADRFNLKVHWDTRDRDVYNLVLAKGGSKLQPPGSMKPSPQESWPGDPKKLPPIHQEGDRFRGYEFYGHNCALEDLAGLMSSMFGKDVVNKTGLTGNFDFHIRYHGKRPGDNRDEDPATVWPPLIDALEDQLGLKLEPAKGPVRVLIIDHIDKPSEN